MSRTRTVAPAQEAGETADTRAAETDGEVASAAAETGGDKTTPASTEPATRAASNTTTATENLPEPAPAEPETSGEVTEAEPGEPTPDSSETEAETEADAETGEPARPRPAWRRLPALLLAAAVLLTGAGVWFTLEARSAAANPAAANLALTDVGATADVTSAVTIAMNQIFSYSYDRTDVTEKAAAAVLRGAAKDSYDKLFAEVRQKAPEQKLVLTSRVSAIAVQELKNGHARLLVFLDQSAVRADNNATDSAAAQLSVTAEHTDGHWVVTALEPR
jgi:Mce-associated membrane protein